MNKDLTLIATLPNINYKDKIIRILECPYIGEVRYNTGTNELMSTKELVNILKMLEDTYKKRIWVDLKGRQLRIAKWADPLYDVVELNHDIEIEYPATILFRNGCVSNILKTRGNKIIVAPAPKEAVGAGQSVNILAKSLDIKGYLTEKDMELLEHCKEANLNNIMASFVERPSDLSDITSILPNADIVCKIESLKGLKFMLETPGLSLMAARDDLFIEMGESNNIIRALEQIVMMDKEAICASRIFPSLKRKTLPELTDYSDLKLMQLMGYKRFMLDDTISHHHFNEAIASWQKVLK